MTSSAPQNWVLRRTVSAEPPKGTLDTDEHRDLVKKRRPSSSSCAALVCSTVMSSGTRVDRQRHFANKQPCATRVFERLSAPHYRFSQATPGAASQDENSSLVRASQCFVPVLLRAHLRNESGSRCKPASR